MPAKPKITNVTPTQLPAEAPLAEPKNYAKTGEYTPAPEPTAAPGTGQEKDRHGLSYKELLAVQAEQLSALECALEAATWKQLKAWCERKNTMGNATTLHRVPRGFELCNWLLERGRFLRDE